MVIAIDSKAIGKRLKEFRLKNNETQEQLAKALDVSKGAISMYELGERIPNDDIKIKYSKHFNRTVQYLFYKD